MTKSEIFKAAHNLAKQTVRFVGNYMIALSLALKEVYTKMTSKINKETLIQAGGKYWEKHGFCRVYMSAKSAKEAGVCEYYNDRKHKMYFNCETEKFEGSSECLAHGFNLMMKD